MNKPNKPTIAAYRQQVKANPNIVSSRRPLYARYKMLATPDYAANTEIELFNHGQKDDLTNFGYAASSGNATALHTNMLAGGRLPKGSHFEVKAVEFILPDDMTLPDARIFGRAEVSWVEGGGSNRLILGRVLDFPQRSGLIYSIVDGTTTTETTTQPRFTGPLYGAGGATLFDIRGNVEDNDLGFLGIKFYETFNVGTEFIFDAQLHGVFHQPVTG